MATQFTNVFNRNRERIEKGNAAFLRGQADWFELGGQPANPFEPGSAEFISYADGFGNAAFISTGGDVL